MTTQTPISTTADTYRYYLQAQSRDGSWYDCLGSSNIETCRSHLEHLRALDNRVCRIVTKTIHILEN